MSRAAGTDAEGAQASVNRSPSSASKESAKTSTKTPAKTSKEDLALVKRAQEGDPEAFRVLFDRYNRRAYAVALGVVKNPQDAMDVVQEAFVKVHRHLPHFQGASSFYTWLYRITMNLSIDHIRRKKNARNLDYDDQIAKDDGLHDPHNLAPSRGDADPDRNAARTELRGKIQEALETLPEYHRQVILLREVEGLSYEEIAKVMKVPKGTIMSRLFHARRKMQAALAPYVTGDQADATEASEAEEA
jgi:RNA polymerase sigma-70 factor (ECF subfamily)